MVEILVNTTNTTVDVECGGDISGQTYGDISSPGYPGDYPANRDCFWTIQVAPGNVIQLLFGTLALETHENCTYDYLEVLSEHLLC